MLYSFNVWPHIKYLIPESEGKWEISNLILIVLTERM